MLEAFVQNLFVEEFMVIISVFLIFLVGDYLNTKLKQRGIKWSDKFFSILCLKLTNRIFSKMKNKDEDFQKLNKEIQSDLLKEKFKPEDKKEETKKE